MSTQIKSPLIILIFIILAGSLLGCTTNDAQAGLGDSSNVPDVAAQTDPTPEPTTEIITEPWEIMLQGKTSHVSRMIAFFDENIGVSAGPTGNMTHFTADGGQTWTQAESSQRCTYGVDIVDQDVIWQCNKMNVSLSTDSGATWELKGQSNHDCNLSFADTENGWVFAPGRLGLFRRTNDGGETWEDITLPEGVEEIAALYLFNPSVGYILDYEGNLYITHDGTQSWGVQSLGLEKNGELKMMKIKGLTPTVIRFSNADNGMIVLAMIGGGDSKVIALYTHDGGITWGAEETIPSEVGVPYLTPDGKLLSIYALSGQKVAVFRDVRN